jgi:hypothetical protein
MLSIISLIKRLSVRFCVFIFLMGSVYALDVDAADAGADGAGLGVGIFDPLTSRLLQRVVVDEMVDKGWIAKSTYFLISQWESCIPRRLRCRYDSSESD